MTTFTPTFGEDAGPPSGGGGGGVQTRTGQVVLTANSSQYQQQMSAAQASTLGVGSAVDSLFSKIDNLFKIGGRTLQIMGAADVATIAEGTANLGAMQKQLSPLIGQTAALKQSMGPVRGAIDQAFATLPVHQANAAAMVQTISQLSVARRDLAGLTKTSLQLSALTGDAALGPNLIQLGRQYGMTSAPQVARSANALITTSRRQGVNPSDVAQFGQAIAPIARQAGIAENAVIGIGTAFSKAGADGYYAANTFNSILSDITQLTRTGSPELAKYSNFLGVTVNQFRRMPPAQQMTQLFDAINKGGPQALVLMNELGLGTRGITAVQGVAQTGGLGRAIAMSQRASTNTRNLDRGANAAMSGLEDQGTRLHNQFTRIADTLAGPFFGALTLVTRGLADFTGWIADALQHMGPIPGILAGIAGMLLPIAGLMLTHAPIVGALAMARMGMRSGPMRAIREGRQTGVAIAGGMSQAEALAMTESGAMFAAGGMPLRAKLPFQAAMFAGQRFGVPGGPMLPAEAAAGPGGAAMAKAYFAKGVFGVPAWMYGAQARQLSDSRVPDYSRSAYGPRGLTGVQGIAANARVLAEQESMMAMLSSEGKNLVSNIGRAGAGIPMAGMGMLGAGMGRAGSVLGRMGSAMFSPWGLAAMIGGPMAMSWMGGINAGQAKLQDTSPYLNAEVNKYDQLLGQTSTNLARFGSAVQDASSKLSGMATPGGLRGASTISAADITTATSGYTPTDSTFAQIAKGGGGAPGAAVAYMQLYAAGHKGMSPQVLASMKTDLISAFGPQKAGQILSQYMATNPKVSGQPTINYSNLAGGVGVWDPSAFASVVGGGITGIRSQAQITPGPRSQRAELGAVLGLLSNSLTRDKNLFNTDIDAIVQGQLSTVFGGKPNDYAGFANVPGTQIAGLAAKGGANAQDVQRVLVSTILGSSAGRKYLSAAGINIAALTRQAGGDQSKLADLIIGQAGGSLPGPMKASAQVSQLTRYGPLGAYAAGSSLFQQAIGSGASSPGVQSRAAEQLAIEASATSANLGLASSRLMVLSDHLGGASTASGQVALAAAQWARTLQSFQMPYLSRSGQLGVLAGNLRQSSAAAARPGASKETIATYHSDQQAYEQSKSSYYQYLQQVFVAARDFHIQMQRSEADYQLQIYRTDRNFQIQQLYAAQDFQRQMFRSHQDFNIQMARESEKAAQQIYNPYQTVQAQTVVSAGQLDANLQDDNSRIQKQLSQLHRLRRLGLSQQAIDMLQLSDPSNSQQLNGIVTSLMNDPGIIKKINDEIKIRGHATTALTQSDFNLDFRNTVADFERQLERAGQDYKTAHERAVTQQQITLEDMATDYNTMVERTAQDLTNQMTELYGSYADQYGKTLDKINKDIGKYAPKLAATLTKELAQANKAILRTEQGALGGGGGGPGSGGQTGGGATGTKRDPIYTPGTVGVNPQGDVGHYDASGHWHPHKGYINPSEAKTLPHIGNPKKAPDVMHGSGATAEQRYAESQFSKYGWNGDQLAPLVALWNQESGWRPTARNPSGAFGIAQALGHGVPGAGAWTQTDQGRLFVDEYPNKAANSGNAQAQIDWGLKYIKAAYGSPGVAWGGYVGRGSWYAEGGIFNKPTVIGVGESGREAVLPMDRRGVSFMAGMWSEVAKMLTANRGTPGQLVTGSTYNHYDHRVQVTGPVEVQAPDAQKFLDTMAAKQRQDRLMGG